MNNALRVLAGLIDLLASYGKRKEQENVQAEADRLHDDPADWFADHFRVRPDTATGDKPKASEADPK